MTCGVFSGAVRWARGVPVKAVAASGSPRRVPQPRRARRRRGPLSRALTVFGLVLLVLAGAVFAGGVLIVNRLNGAVVPGNLLGSARAPRGVRHGPLNYLLIGSNFRDDNPSNGERADSIMIVHIPRGEKRGYLVSVPRDLYYTIKPYPPTGFQGST